MGSGPKTTTTTNTKSKQKTYANTKATTSNNNSFDNNSTAQRGMYAPTQPIMDRLIGNVGNISGDPTKFGPVRGEETENAQGQMLNIADQGSQALDPLWSLRGNAGGTADAGFGQLQSTISGDYLEGNPFLSKTLDRVSNDVANDVNSHFSAAGRYGSAAHTESLAENIADARFKAEMENYQGERARQFQAGLTGANYGTVAADAGKGIDQANMFAPTLTGRVGEMRDAYDQESNLADVRATEWGLGQTSPIAANFGEMATSSSGSSLSEGDSSSVSKGRSNTNSQSVQEQEQERDLLGMALGAGISGLGMLGGNPLGALTGMTNMAGAPTTGWGATVTPTGSYSRPAPAAPSSSSGGWGMWSNPGWTSGQGGFRWF